MDMGSFCWGFGPRQPSTHGRGGARGNSPVRSAVDPRAAGTGRWEAARMTTATPHAERPIFTSAIDWVVPVRPLARLLRSARPALALVILAGAIVFVAGVAAAIFLLNGTSRSAATRASRSFDTAVVANQPGIAPPGASAYVAGVRARFGPVTAATFLGAHNHGVNGPDNTDNRTFYEAAVLLQTRRGPVALELAFDNHSLSSERVSSIRELRPDEVDGLGVATRRALARAFAARGGHAATASVLLAPPHPVTARHAAVRTQTVHMPSALKCVQQARGDVTKLQACASP